jgi:aspartyl-tRNA(Asn)/glutamyl-tRNA(Gln) amidotransferase subunit A
VPEQTAEAVRLLEDAGYANVGKTNLHEFAYGVTSQNPHFGTVPNPIAPGRVAGGSSGGSAAALAARLADAALGTDSGGSIRIPAAFCRAVGFKPTYGLVPIDGCYPLAPSFDHAGPMGRDVSTCARMLQALAPGFEPRRIEALEEVSVGVAWMEHADPLVAQRVAAAAALFPRRRELELPLPEGIGPVFMREVADVHRELFRERADAYGDNVRTKIERCLAVSDNIYERALGALDAYRERCADAVGDVDVVVTPTVPCVAPRADIDELEVREQLIRFTFPFNCLGWPALALPCGRAENGLPASVQLAAPKGADAGLLAVGELLERLLPRDSTS